MFGTTVLKGCWLDILFDTLTGLGTGYITRSYIFNFDLLETTSWQSDMPTFEGSGKEVELFDVYVIEGKYVRLI